MVHKNLLEILAKNGLAKDGDAFSVPSGLSVTVYLEIGTQPLCVDRVTRIEVGAETATVVTHRKERFVVELDAVAAVRFHPESGGPGYA